MKKDFDNKNHQLVKLTARIKCFESAAQLTKLLSEKQLIRLRIIAWGEHVLVGRGTKGIFAAKDECPHARAPMSRGFITQFGDIVCPLHGYVFDIQTGKVLSGEQCADLLIYKLETEEDGVWLSK